MNRMTLAAVAMLLLAGCKKSGDGDDDDGGDSESGAKLSEAVQHLRELGKAAKQIYRDTGKFPLGTSATLPVAPPEQSVAKGCCGGPSNKCPISDWASDPVWKRLGWKLGEPSNYRYTYASKDGTSFTATAEGDLDCDGAAATFTIAGTAEGGKPKTRITKPPVGEY